MALGLAPIPPMKEATSSDDAGEPREEAYVMKVLIVEDDRRLGEFLKQGFGECRYTATWVRTCKEASEALSETPFDAVVLDLSLPDGDGLEMLHQWRKSGFNEPVLILSARVSMEDRVKGLDLGADDYLPKPFGLEELLARVRSLVRRQSTVKHTVLEYALLEVFMQNHGRILARTLITDKIWASSYDVDTNLLDVYMSRLRAKLETMSGKTLFRTVRGVGYQLI